MTTQNTHHLQISNLSCSRGDLPLYQQLCFTLKSGEMRIIRGGNGTGKTTLLEVIAGLKRADSGKILWDDTPIKQAETYPECLCYIGHRPALRQALSVYDNLLFYAQLYRNTELLNAAMGYFDLQALAHLPVSALSAGWVQRTQLARLILSPASLWLLDEPTQHLDAKAISLLQSLITTRLERKGMVLMASHAKIEGINAEDISLDSAPPQPQYLEAAC
jgi:heme exporter protein A